MIIVEGGDLVGKTTFCHKLLEHLPGYWYRHLSKPPEGFDGCAGYIDLAVMRSVQDRFHMSEIVYARMRGDEPMCTPEKYRLVDAQLRLMGALTVVLTQDEETIRDNWREGEMYNLEQCVEVNLAFRCLVDDIIFADNWQPDVDVHIHGYPSDEDVHRVLDLYAERQELIADATRI